MPLATFELRRILYISAHNTRQLLISDFTMMGVDVAQARDRWGTLSTMAFPPLGIYSIVGRWHEPMGMPRYRGAYLFRMQFGREIEMESNNCVLIHKGFSK